MTWLLSLKPRLVALFAALLVGFFFILRVFALGKNSEKLSQLQKQQEQRRTDDKIKADTAALSAADRRNRLSERWSSK